MLIGIINSIVMSLSKFREIVKTGKPGMLQSTGSQIVRCELVTEQQQQFIGAFDKDALKVC